MINTKNFAVFRRLFSVCIALLCSFIIIFFVSEEPVLAIMQLVSGPLRSVRNLSNVVETMIPLVFTGTGVCIMFSANQMNLACEGSFHLGGLTAAMCTILLGTAPLLSPVMALTAAGICGALYTAIPAVLKIKTGATELVSSLMLNYIALWLATYLMMRFIRDPQVGAASLPIPDAASFHALIGGTRIHVGIIIAICAAILGDIFLYRTKPGYEIRIVGENEIFARYSGINVTRVIFLSQLIGGLAAGIGGGIEILSPVYSRFSWTGLLGYGWDAIIICTLVKKRPLYTIPAALFLAYLRTGASIMARTTDVTLEIVQITQGIIIMLAVAEKFLERYRMKLVEREAKSSLKKDGGVL